MSITDGLRRVFDDCTVTAGVEDKFECVYITKAAALKCLDEIDEAFAEGHARAVEYGKTLNPKTAKRVVTTNPETDGATEELRRMRELGMSAE